MDNSLVNQHKRYAETGKAPAGYKKGGKAKGFKVKKQVTVAVGGDNDNDADDAMPPVASNPTPPTPGSGFKKGGKVKNLPHLAKGGALNGMHHHGCDNY